MSKGIFWGIFTAFLFTAFVASAQFGGSLWFPNSDDRLQPVDDTWGIYTTKSISFDGELLPDGLTCANGQILKRTAANDWDCAVDADSGGAPALNAVTDATASSTIQIGSSTWEIGSASASTTFAIDGDLGRVTINQLKLNASSTLLADLGLTIGTDTQAFDAQLLDIAGLAVTDNNIIVGNGSNWVAESGATARTSLGLSIGTDVQAYDDELRDIASSTPTKGDLITSDGTDWLDLAVGTDGLILMASSSPSNGIAWVTCATLTGGAGLCDGTDADSGGTPALNTITDATASSTIQIGSSTWEIGSGVASTTFAIDGDLGRVTINQLKLNASSTLLADLGLTIGTDTQAYDDELRDVASSTPTKGDLIASDGTDWLDFLVGTDAFVLMASSSAPNGFAWEPCATLTGSSGLCDGDDGGGSGASTTLDVIEKSNASSTIEMASNTLTIDTAGASSTLVLDGDLGRITINSLKLTSSSTLMADLGLTIGTDVQAYDDELRDVASSTPTKGDLIVSDGTDWLDFAIGSDDTMLTASSSASNGLAWVAWTFGDYLTGTGYDLDLDAEVAQRVMGADWADAGFKASSTVYRDIDNAITIQEAQCYGGADASATVQIEWHSPNTPLTASSTNVLTTELSSGGGTVASTTTLTTSVIDADSVLAFIITGASSTAASPDFHHCSLFFKIND